MNQRDAVILFTILNLMVIGVAIICAQAAAYQISQEQIVVIVQEKITTPDGRMMIKAYYAGGRTEILEFKNVYVKFVFNSGELYSRVREDHQYQLTVGGLNFPQIGWHRTVLEVNGQIV